MKKSRALLSLFCSIVCICAVLCSCSGGKDDTTTASPSPETSVSAAVSQQARSKIGSGKFTFVFEVVDANGSTTAFDIATDKNTVGEALSSIGMISGEQGDFGLYVKTVNGITADYDTDGTYWSFLVNGEAAPQGVDTTYVKNGSTYTFKVEK